ncbi:L,D-transpeptidase [Rhizobium sp. BT03]|uniref:L,D-transpeptidase n=1 Tax=Rhizobium sp. BT03 TaxID=3045156 RepID=UPI0024B3D85C|nr:L,D-transpeptidase [Rhizobium sp. BT03]WHO76761.1 L,D-transpeptidase [Rhizobium sp. BT03]
MKAIDSGRIRSRAAGAGLAVLAILAAAGDAAAAGLVPRSLGPTTSAVVTIEKSYVAGTIVIVTANRTLDLVISGGRAIRYKIGVGRDGFRWSGTVKVGRKAEWPDWRPPAEMKARSAGLPDLVPAGPLNPLGARGIYLYKDRTDTLYRIHGTNEQSTVGGFASSGCFRMSNADVIDLYERVKVGSTVIVK